MMPSPLLRTMTCLLVLLLAGASASAQSPCPYPEAHQFDFWIGEWEVTENGQPAGTNSIQPKLDGCVLEENWQGASGGAGSSFNFYNPQTAQWQQFWVWANGTTLEAFGAYADGKMVLSGESKDREGKPVLNRITWYDNADHTVRQHWEMSRDGGETWQNAFDGHYRRRGEPAVHGEGSGESDPAANPERPAPEGEAGEGGGPTASARP